MTDSATHEAAPAASRKRGRKSSRKRRRQPLTLHKPIVLIGLMGAGKSSVGKCLARRLHLPFYDSDTEIEAAAGCSISDIFEKYGEEEFRKGERRVLERLLGEPRMVLATGGGAFMDENTRSLIKKRAVSIWLNADIDVLVERTSRRDTRPLLRGKDPVEVLSGLAATRYPIYAKADIHVMTGRGPQEDVVEKIIRALKRWQRKQKQDDQHS